MRTSGKNQRGTAMADFVLFGLALLLLALPLPLPALLGRVDLGADRLLLLGVIVAVPAMVLLVMHGRASRAAVRPAVPEPRPLVAARAVVVARSADVVVDEPTMDPDEISASIAAAVPATRRLRSSVAPAPRDARDPAA
jgi:hypothetical protein